MNKLLGSSRRSSAIALWCLLLVVLPLRAQQFEFNTDRNGSDYSGFDLPAPNPQLCLDQCRGDNRCAAWTFVRPGVQGPAARCYLKNPAPPASRNECCVSGTVTRIIDQQTHFEVNTDRHGSDYRSFDLPTAVPDLCMEQCRNDSRCAAWTFVRPGVQGPLARCYLKDPAPPPSPNSCCVSGVIPRQAAPPPPPQPIGDGRIRYDRPAVNGVAIDHCASWASQCGKAGADQFCRRQGHDSASSFQVFNPGRTYVLGDRRVCEGGNCVGFSQVICASMAPSAPPPPPPPPLPSPSPPPPPPPPSAAAGTTWWTTASPHLSAADGQRFSYQCPPMPLDGSMSLWGTDIYTFDSGICMAGVHSGVITRERGGVVTIEMRPGQALYPATQRHGVWSQGYGAYNRSFAVVTGAAQRVLPVPAPAPAQSTVAPPAQAMVDLGRVWNEVEEGEQAIWTRRPGSNVFDASWSNGRVRAVLQMSLAGNQVTIQRTQGTDGYECVYTGTIVGNQASGSFGCNRFSGQKPWRATIGGDGVATAVTAPPKAAQYLGCFRDPNNPFDLDGHLERSRQNTPQRCVQICAGKGFRFAGVQYAESCLCGSSYGRFGQADNCTMPCTGDSRQVCGGMNANSVYSTGR